ncbi:MAG: ARMT1-like domain-containing protein [Elusimicrobiota bacterium]|nr:ARMT1-like domain-containing protein [Elusimicrobiota bacterium]
MKTYLDCIPCFYRQALEASRLAGATEEKQKLILDELASVLPRLSMDITPPEIAISIYSIVNRVTQMEDLYRDLKDRSTDLALKIYDRLKEIVVKSKEPLKTAARLAILGNIIDYGTQHSFALDEELDKILSASENLKGEVNYAIFDFSKFQRALEKSETILYLADNAGETVFDRILIESINNIYGAARVIYAVKEKPVINDAVLRDAVRAGLDSCSEIVSSGSCAPGTLLTLCSAEFLKIFEKADTVISKGQGNFEVLNEVNRPIFFMFKAKCAVVARDIGCGIGDAILFYKQAGARVQPREYGERTMEEKK